MGCKAFDDEGRRLATVEGKIHEVVRSMRSDVDYKFMNWAQVNEAIDGLEKPTVLYVLPPSGNLNVSLMTNSVKDSPTTIIGFLSSTELDFSGHRNDNVIERMKRLCVEFVKAYNESGLFEPLDGKIPYQVIYDALDDNVTGITINVRIDEVDGVSMCDEPLRLDSGEIDDFEPNNDNE